MVPFGDKENKKWSKLDDLLHEGTAKICFYQNLDQWSHNKLDAQGRHLGLEIIQLQRMKPSRGT